MIDIENAVFTVIADAFDAKYPNGERWSENIQAPAKFPCLTVVEEDNYTYQSSLDGDLREHHAKVMYSVNVYSNDPNRGKLECREVLRLVDEQFMKLGFTRLAYGFSKNKDTRISRATARYQGVVDENYRIYRR